MRVVKFVTLFLALSVVTGCSHRRAQQARVTPSLCECAACRCDQERLIREGAIPADHYNDYQPSEASAPVEVVSPFATPSKPNDFAPQYATEPSDGAKQLSPFASGNPIEMDMEAPGTFSPPTVDEIRTDTTPFQSNDPANDLQLNLPSANPITPPGDVPSETIPDGAFKPFNRDVFKVKSKIEDAIPLQDQPSILIEKVSKKDQPDLSSIAPAKNPQLQLSKLREPEANDFQLPDAIVPDAMTLEQNQTEITAPVESVAETFQPKLSQLAPKAKVVVPAPQETAPVAQPQAPVAMPIRHAETVVQGELYENPVVLYARQRRDILPATPVQKPRAIRPVSAQRPVEPESIVQNSQYDPIYGLPLTNKVDFDSLPAIEPQRVTPPQAAPPQTAPSRVAPSNQAQHLHLHIHHDYSNAETGQVRQIQQTGQQASNVQVVYRDDEGRVIMAPPTPAASIHSAQPVNDQRTYYVPPEQILRLKATSPISRPRSNPSVATIQMRDTIIHGGTHLLATPDYQAQPVLTNHGLPGINHEKLREAFKTSPTDNPLR